MFLEGLRILDCSRILAGPLATQVLADLGAEVLKIEPPQGDDTRTWGPPFQKGQAAYFQSCNRNKSSLVLNLKDPADRQRLMDLVAKADVMVDNYPDAVRDKLDLSAEKLRAHNPDLITLSITGYADDRSSEPGYDVMIQAEAGLMGVTGPVDGEPHKVGVALVDVLTGYMSANGVLAALLRRERQGGGAALRISLYQTALYSLVNVAANTLVDGRPSSRWGNAHPNLVPYQDFPTLDGALIIGAGNDAQFQRLCNLLGIDDPELTALDNAGRVAHRKQLIGRIAERTRTFQAEKLRAQLQAHKIPCAPILRPDQAIAAAQTWSPHTLIAMQHPELGEVRSIANPLRGDGLRNTHQAPPQLGEGGEAMARRWTS